MISTYLTIFYDVCIQFVPLVPAVLGIYLILKLVADLLFKD